MAKISTMTTKGLSGREYSFSVYPMGQEFREVGGVYVVTRRYKNDAGEYKHVFVYIGETGDFSTRFINHHKARCFQNHKATCICTLIEEDQDARLAVEDDLVKQHDPPCNG
ncbi:MAG: hypothetical protein ABSH56_37285 [Bryobacteraceae bacterium]|jgi:hypothetical protein